MKCQGISFQTKSGHPECDLICSNVFIGNITEHKQVETIFSEKITTCYFKGAVKNLKNL